MNTDKVVKAIKTKYKDVLGDVTIELVDSYGRTAYNPEQKSIVLYLDSLEDFIGSKRFAKRLGKVDFKTGIILTLLHEIGHVHQEREYGKETLYLEQRKIDDAENHDDNWLEKEADKFARIEFKKLNLTKRKS